MSAADKGRSPIWIIGAVLLGAGGVGAYFYVNQAPEAGSSDALVQVAQPETVEQTTNDNVAEVPVDVPVETAAPEIEIPPVYETRLDEVRIDGGGVAVIAGQSEPDTTVILRADGEELARADTDASGSFATVAIISPSDSARVLTVTQLDSDGVESVVQDELILAPVTVVLAEAETVDTTPAESETAADVVVPSADEQPVDIATTDLAQDAASADNSVSVDTEIAIKPDAQDSVQDLDGVAVAALDVVAPETSTPGVNTAPNAPAVDANGDPLPETATLEQQTRAQTLSVQDDVASIGTDGLATQGTATDVTPQATEKVSDQSAPSAPAQPQSYALLRSDKDGINVVQPARTSPQVQSQVALDAISYSLEGDVQLTGRAQDSADQVQVYLNNKPIAALTVDEEGGWRGALPDIDTGVYTLRIDEVNDAGTVTSRVETPFKREDPEVLKEATEQAEGGVAAITVQKGATLWAIARERYGEGTLFVRVFEANKDSIRDPNLIYPGQVFNLPEN